MRDEENTHRLCIKLGYLLIQKVEKMISSGE